MQYAVNSSEVSAPVSPKIAAPQIGVRRRLGHVPDSRMEQQASNVFCRTFPIKFISIFTQIFRLTDSQKLTFQPCVGS